MARNIFNCPPVPDIKPSERQSDTITRTHNIKVLTPIFGGGAETGVNDPVTPIRPSSGRGHLRFWWRATRGASCQTIEELRQREGEIWGTTESPSAVSVEVQSQHHMQTRKPEDYYGFPRYGAEAYALFSALQNQNVLATEALSFSLSLRWLGAAKLQELRNQENKRRLEKGKSLLRDRIEPIDHDVECAVWAWVNFGGIGARTRRGCGALFCTKSQPEVSNFHPPSVDGFAQWLRDKTETYRFPLLAQHDHRAWPTFPSTICLKKGSEIALASWSEAIDTLKEFRQGRNYGRDPGGQRPGRSRWPEAESVRNLVVSQRGLGTRPPPPNKWHVVDARIPPTPSFPRAEFGMPIILEIRGEKVPHPSIPAKNLPSLKPSLQPNKESDRMASPVILRPIYCSDKRISPMIAILNTEPLKSAYLKPGARSGDLTTGVAISANQIRDAGLASYTDSPMGSSGTAKSPRSPAGSALEAFVVFAIDEKGFVKVKP
jgi:CRISPR-associated protein Cmr1